MGIAHPLFLSKFIPIIDSERERSQTKVAVTFLKTEESN